MNLFCNVSVSNMLAILESILYVILFAENVSAPTKTPARKIISREHKIFFYRILHKVNSIYATVCQCLLSFQSDQHCQNLYVPHIFLKSVPDSKSNFLSTIRLCKSLKGAVVLFSCTGIHSHTLTHPKK